MGWITICGSLISQLFYLYQSHFVNADLSSRRKKRIFNRLQLQLKNTDKKVSDSVSRFLKTFQIAFNR